MGKQIPWTATDLVNFLDQKSAAFRCNESQSKDFAAAGLVRMESEFTRSVNVRLGSEAAIRLRQKETFDVVLAK